jgi:hypothetical protein
VDDHAAATESVEQHAAADDQSPVRPGQPGFGDEPTSDEPHQDEPIEDEPIEDEPADEAPVDDEPLPGQPFGQDQPDAGDQVPDQSPVRPGQPGFDGDFLNELPQDDASAGDDLLSDEMPVAPGQPGFGEEPADDMGFVFEPTDMSQWSTPGLPADWEPWTSPVPESADSWTDDGYSTDWGLVQPEWAIGGEDPTTVVQPDHPVSGIFGPGHALDVQWANQGQTNYCGLYSVRTILSEVTGRPVDMDEMIHRATANGWFQYDDAGHVKGILTSDIDDILASYGVGSHQFGGPGVTVTDHDAWQALNTALTNNQRLIVGVDGREFDQGHDVGTPGTIDMDHFVAVEGVDYTRGVVILNDSARKAGLEVPLDVFFNSWRDSNFSMTFTDTHMPGDGTAHPVDGGPDPNAPDIGVIGTTLTPEPGDDAASTADPGTVDGTEHVDGDTTPAPAPQQLGVEHDGEQDPGQHERITAERDAVGSDRDDSAAHADGLARPTVAAFGDLPADLAGIDLSDAVGKDLDLGIDKGSDSVMPHGIVDEITPDGGILDEILDLLGSLDDVVVDVAKQVLTLNLRGGMIT